MYLLLQKVEQNNYLLVDTETYETCVVDKPFMLRYANNQVLNAKVISSSVRIHFINPDDIVNKPAFRGIYFSSLTDNTACFIIGSMSYRLRWHTMQTLLLNDYLVIEDNEMLYANFALQFIYMFAGHFVVKFRLLNSHTFSLLFDMNGVYKGIVSNYKHIVNNGIDQVFLSKISMMGGLPY